MSSDQLLSLHPAGKFAENSTTQSSIAGAFSQIDAMYGLTADEKNLLDRHGFVVTERVRPMSFGGEFLKIYQADLPVFVSTDAILHALHMSYDLILRTAEEQIIIPAPGTASRA
jgi:Protein of unknown function (DUF3160)